MRSSLVSKDLVFPIRYFEGLQLFNEHENKRRNRAKKIAEEGEEAIKAKENETRRLNKAKKKAEEGELARKEKENEWKRKIDDRLRKTRGSQEFRKIKL